MPTTSIITAMEGIADGYLRVVTEDGSVYYVSTKTGQITLEGQSAAAQIC